MKRSEQPNSNETQPEINEPQVQSSWEAFWARPDVVKAKGFMKIGLGVLILQPQLVLLMGAPPVALYLGAALCTASIVALAAQKVIGSYEKSNLLKDLFNGNFVKDLKNSLASGVGMTVGLLAPYIGAAVAVVGVVALMSGRPEGIEGLFQGGMLATAVGAVALPALGYALVAEGIVNGLGADYSLIGKTFSIAKDVCLATGRFIGLVEKNTSPSNVVDTITQQAGNVEKSAAPAVKEVTADAKAVGAQVKENLSPEHHSAISNVGTVIMKYVSKIVHHHPDEARTNHSPQGVEPKSERKVKGQ